MQVRVLFFAAVREGLGQSDLECHTTATTVGALREELMARGAAWHEVLHRDRNVRASVNRRMATDATPLPDGAEVAFFPPVTGG